MEDVNESLLEIEFKDIIKNETDDSLCHYGTKRHSGRYPWGSGKDPYQSSSEWYKEYLDLKKTVKNESEISDIMSGKAGDEKYSKALFQAYRSIALGDYNRDMVAKINSLRKDGLSNPQIAKKLGLAGESTVRSFMDPVHIANKNKNLTLYNALKPIVDEKRIVDFSDGVEAELGIKKTRLDTLKEMFASEGYHIYKASVPNLFDKSKKTYYDVLAAPGVSYKECLNTDNIKSLNNYTVDTETDTIHQKYVYPKAMKRDRLMIRYADEGGIDKDGMIQLRRNVKDLDLGPGIHYSQVRILVDTDGNKRNDLYLKGMAVYGNDKDFPPGVDVIFNTNKVKGTADKDVLKKASKNLDKDPENPFGSLIKQQMYYTNEKGESVLGLINKRASEGDWSEWANTVPSQFLSKQPYTLIKQQLSMTLKDKELELKDISGLTNPTLKKKLLEDYADMTDKAAVDLKSISLPGQNYHVILSIPSLKENEIYAPNYKDGEELALIRYPHGGIFEIPKLRVNNKNKEGIEVISPNATDAVGINPKVAGRLSGADFDGDTVMVIPLSKTNVQNRDPLQGLVNFEPKLDYGADPVASYEDKNGVMHYIRNGSEFKPMTDTQKQMGIISNLITDMTLAGANSDELARAVRHSMVVIDAEKHHLDYIASEQDNGIDELKRKYQAKEGGKYGGAATIISRARSPIKDVPERIDGKFYAKDTGNELKIFDVVKNDDGHTSYVFIDPETGEILKSQSEYTKRLIDNTGKKLYTDTNRTYETINVKTSSGKNKKVSVFKQYDGLKKYKDPDTGDYVTLDEDDLNRIKVTKATMEMPQMAYNDDAMSLVRDKHNLKEIEYAKYANKLKDLANQARLEYYKTPENKYSPEARLKYKKEADELNDKLNECLLNKPRERQAQAIANYRVKLILNENPAMDPDDIKKIKTKELNNARLTVGARRHEIWFTDRQWEAIQAGAIGVKTAQQLFAKANTQRLYELALPRENKELSDAQISRIKNMASANMTNAQIAERIGVSSTTINKYLKGDN